MMRHFYGVDDINFAGVTGDGRNQTIAIVDAYDDPNALSDLQHFDSFYGLAAPPSFQQFNQSGRLLTESGGTGLAPSNGKHGNGWQIEESLDIEWAHVIAPAAKIDLVETNSDSFTDLFAGVDAAAPLTNVVCVSMSWGSNGEFSGENTYDSNFTNSGVTYLGATGDNGKNQTSYPAAASNVVAVGGTTMQFAAGTTDGTYSNEVAWSGTGGELSPDESKPSYQNAVLTGTKRGTPDVSMEADPNTGVAIYDSYDFGTSAPWAQYGGTSLATPMWSALIAITDQGRASIGQAPLSGRTQTLPQLYALPLSDFHDVTSGSNGGGNIAKVGYDTVTGIGTPVANKLVNGLSGATAAVVASKLAFTQQPADTAAGSTIDSPNGVKVAVEDGSGNVITGDSSTVMLTLNAGTFAGGGTTATAQAQRGIATFSSLVIDASGSYTFTASDSSLPPANSASFNIKVGPPAELAFGQQPSDGTTGNPITPAVTVLVEDAGGNLVTTDGSTVTLTISTHTFSNGSQTVTAPAQNGVATFSNLVINYDGSYKLSATDGSLTQADSNLFSMMAVDVINVTSGNDTVTLTQDSDAQHIDWSMGSSMGVIDISDANGLTINGDGGADTIILNNSGGNPLPNVMHLNGAFTINGLQGSNPLADTTLDINRSTVFIDYDPGSDPLALIRGYLQAGYNNGAWNVTAGPSTGVITSTAAANNAQQTTAIGYADSADGLIAGQPANTIELKYTLYGDTTLTGTVGFNDFTRLTQNYGATAGGTWDTGDFNYDGITDANDFTLLSRDYNSTLGSA